MLERDYASYISQCLELAILLESSVHKPGNLSVVTNFEKTRYEHFLASAVAATPSFTKAVEQGMAISARRIRVDEAGVGSIIKDCIADIDKWQRGGNTLLGTVILLIPLAVASGMAFCQARIPMPKVREKLGVITRSTTPEDAVEVYDAIRMAKPGGLGDVPELDLADSDSQKKILEEETTLFEVFEIARGYDMICAEWVNNYPVTFEEAYPSLRDQFQNGVDLETAVLQTFLEILAEYPDTLIARKVGNDRAKNVSKRAAEILTLGGPRTQQGKNALKEFDGELRREDNLLNPGTTADIIVASLALCILDGYRP